MQPLNDDMEELFKRAGEEYPLNTNGADWNKVLQKLHHADDDVAEANKNKRDYRYLWLLLLLPLGFMLGRYFNNEHKLNTAKSNKSKAFAATASSVSGTRVADTKTKGTDSKALVTDVVPGKEVTNSKADNSMGNLSGGNTTKNKLFGGNHPGNRVNKAARQATRSEGVLMKTTATRKEGSDESQSLALMASKEKQKDRRIEEKAAVGATPSAEVTVASSDLKPGGTSAAAATNNKNDSNNKSVDENKADISKQGANKKQRTSFKRKLFYSFLAGPDISTVKLERASNVGYGLGLMLGYEISKKITVEAGVLWDRKNYKATGEYLDTSRLQIPRHSIVSKVDGYCDMIEIPINVKYHFAIKQNHSWFISAGLSSYLMQKENYNLTYQRYSVPYEKDYGYKNSSKDWFSILNVSAGYQKSLGKYTFISIAPYVKLPLKGVGIGKLPITSTGIYVSASRSIH